MPMRSYFRCLIKCDFTLLISGMSSTRLCKQNLRAFACVGQVGGSKTEVKCSAAILPEKTRDFIENPEIRSCVKCKSEVFAGYTLQYYIYILHQIANQKVLEFGTVSVFGTLPYSFSDRREVLSEGKEFCGAGNRCPVTKDRQKL